MSLHQDFEQRRIQAKDRIDERRVLENGAVQQYYSDDSRCSEARSMLQGLRASMRLLCVAALVVERLRSV